MQASARGAATRLNHPPLSMLSGMNRRTKWKWIVAISALALLAVAGRVFPLAEWLRDASEWTRSLGTAGAAIYALIYAVAAMLCIPCLPLTIGAGVLFGWLTGLAAVVGGSALAAAGGFLIARHSQRGRLVEWLREKRRFRAVDRAVAQEGWKIVGLLRMVPLPFGLSNYFFGLTGVDFRHYLLATIVGMLPGNAVFVYLGAVGSGILSGEKPHHPLEYALAAFAVAGIAGAGYLIARRVVPDRRKTGG